MKMSRRYKEEHKPNASSVQRGRCEELLYGRENTGPLKTDRFFQLDRHQTASSFFFCFFFSVTTAYGGTCSVWPIESVEVSRTAVLMLLSRPPPPADGFWCSVVTSQPSPSCKKTRVSCECFPYMCPEPVLVILWYSYNGPRRRVFLPDRSSYWRSQAQLSLPRGAAGQRCNKTVFWRNFPMFVQSLSW